MRTLLDDLLISEVAAVSGASQDLIKNWLRYDLISAPPIVGKHRRFTAQNTVEVILMAELNSIGLRPSAIARLLHSSRIAQLVEFVGEHAVEHGDQIAIFEPYPWALMLDGQRCLDLGVKAEINPIGLPPLTLIIRCDQLLSEALNRALVVTKARDA